MAYSDADTKRMADQVMQGYGRARPSDRNTVMKYLAENPDYANLIAHRLGVQGSYAPDDRYENVMDSTAMKTLMKSMDDGKGDVAKPAPTASSGKKKTKPVDTKMRGDEGLNPRTGMQSERASDEIARRQESDRESQRGKGFSQATSSQTSSNPQTTQTDDSGHGVRDAVVGLGVGGTIGYLLNKMFGNQKTAGISPDTGATATPRRPVSAPDSMIQRAEGRSMVPSPQEEPIDVPFRDVTGDKLMPPVRQLPAPVEQLPAPVEQLPPPDPRQLPEPPRQIGMSEVPQTGTTQEEIARMLRMRPQGPTMTREAASATDELAPPPAAILDNLMRASRARVQKVPKVGRF